MIKKEDGGDELLFGTCDDDEAMKMIVKVTKKKMVMIQIIDDSVNDDDNNDGDGDDGEKIDLVRSRCWKLSKKSAAVSVKLRIAHCRWSTQTQNTSITTEI